jgi:hypothetical protein
MKLTRRAMLAGIGAAPVAAPLVARANSYSLKPVNDGFAAVVETKDFGALASDPVIAAELQRKIDRHLILHVRPEKLLTRPDVGRMAYHLGYPSDGRIMPRNPGTPPINGGTETRARTPGKYGEWSFIADFGGPADALPTQPRKPRYIETLHTDGGAYSVNVTIDVPPAAPHTFADMRAAYRALPRDLKRVVETRFALHAGTATTSTPYDELPAFDAATALRRPLLLAHSRTAEPLLYLPKNPHSRIEGMPDDEAHDILTQLWAGVDTQRNRYMAWSGENQAMIWDAFGTTHTNPSYRRDKARETWFFIVPSPLPLTQAKVTA